MDISASTEKTIKTLSTIGAGGISWLYTATGSQMQTPLFTKQRLSDALGGMLGKDLAKQITGVTTIKDFQIHPMGWANQVVFGGIAGKIINGVLKSNVPQYRNIPIVPELIDGVTTGMIAGGAIGGIFDPSPGGYTALSQGNPVISGQGEYYGGVATGNVP
jgi:hypothetical protein